MAAFPPRRGTSQDPDPGAALMQMLGGARVAQVVHVGAQLGIADLLVEGPCHVSDLAAKLGAHEASLLRLMRALLALGVFAETEVPGTFSLTPVSERLVSSHPRSLRHAAIFNGVPEVYLSWGQLLHSVKTGECAFSHLYGKDMFEHMRESTGTASAYNAAMSDFSAADAEAVLEAYDFGGEASVLDVGGGEGELLLRILEAHPGLTGALLELPAVVAGARARVAQRGLGDRCRVLEGSFLEAFPVGEDRYSACTAKNIVLNWDDGHAVSILRHCHRVLRAGSKVLVMEPVLGEAALGPAVPLIDVNMLLVCPGGRLRTEDEHRRLLHKAGFELARIVLTKTTMRILEAVKQGR